MLKQIGLIVTSLIIYDFLGAYVDEMSTTTKDRKLGEHVYDKFSSDLENHRFKKTKKKAR